MISELKFYAALACSSVLLAALVFSTYLAVSRGSALDQCEQSAVFERQYSAQVIAEFRARQQAIIAEHDRKIAELRAEYAKQVGDAKAAGDRTAADLRAGNLRLREHWSTCQGDPGVREAAEAASGADGEAGLRAESVGRIHAAVAECEARVTALQDYARAVSE